MQDGRQHRIGICSNAEIYCTSILLGPLPFLTLAAKRVQVLCWSIFTLQIDSIVNFTIFVVIIISPTLTLSSKSPSSVFVFVSQPALVSVDLQLASRLHSNEFLSIVRLVLSTFACSQHSHYVIGKRVFSCLSTESQRDPQRDIPSSQFPGSHHLQSEQRMTKVQQQRKQQPG